jgi:signal transduction histidine kinase
MNLTARRTWLTLTHVMLNPLVSIVCFVLWIIGLTLSIGTAITVVGGAFFLLLTLKCSAEIGRFERQRAEHLLGVKVVPPSIAASSAVPRSGRAGGSIRQQLTSVAAWKALAYVIIQPVVGTIGFCVTLSIWSGGIMAALLPIYRRALPAGTAQLGIATISTNNDALAVAAIGLGILVLAPFVTLAAGSVDAALMEALLGGGREAELVAQVTEAQVRRVAAVDSAETERRRIERDLHDGAQQRLVALGMTLGMAREKLDSNPVAARELLDEAHAEAKSAMTELRAIARGIHPAILDDRGLDAALSALAARCPVPVTITVDLPERQGTVVEGTAYYVVSEALTNIAKHAKASAASVTVVSTGDRRTQGGASKPFVTVVITDNGVGGATVAPDGGLAGLHERVAGVGGTLTVVSPVGGPTTIAAELPR